MAKGKEEGDEKPELSDAERLQRMETSVRFNKLLLIVLGALCIILLSAVITGTIVIQQSLDKAPAPAEEEKLTDAAGEAAPSLRKRLAAIEATQGANAARMDEIQKATASLQIIERTGQVEKMLEILRQQERDYRDLMINLKAGMHDLSRMVPGSRTWLEEYNERIDRGLANSREREKRLREVPEIREPAGA